MFEIKYEFDLTVDKRNVSELRKYPGVYVLFNKDKKAVYVGMTWNIRKRARQHFGGYTNTTLHSKDFCFISVVYETDIAKQETLEYYLIRKLSPIINRSKKFSVLPLKKFNLKEFECKGETVDKNPCKGRPHTNGYCWYHGGNGISLTDYLNDAAEKALLDLKESMGF